MPKTFRFILEELLFNLTATLFLFNPTLSSCLKKVKLFGSFPFLRGSPWLCLLDQPPVTGWSKRHNHGDLGLLG
jgi:hypothetical protein